MGHHRGQALIDRELYLPKEWTDDRERCRAAHVPGQVGFATKPRQAEQMIDRILPSLPEGRVWVAADEVYGRDGAFRAFLEQRRLPHAVTVPANQTVLPRPGWRHIARLVQRVASEEDWVELPAGPSQAGTRAWQWWVRRVPDPDSEVCAGPGHGGSSPGAARGAAERDYFFARGPEETPAEEPVRPPGAVAVEDAIKLAGSACGLADSALLPRLVLAHHLRDVAAASSSVQDARVARGAGRRHALRQRGGGAVTAIASSHPVHRLRNPFLLVLIQPQLAQTEAAPARTTQSHGALPKP